MCNVLAFILCELERFPCLVVVRMPPTVQAFSSLVKVDFWTELATKKLDTYRLNDDAQASAPAVQLQLTPLSEGEPCSAFVDT